MRRVLSVVAMCLVVVLAGCVGMGGLGDSGEDSEAAAATPDDAAGGSGGSGGASADTAEGGDDASGSDDAASGDGASNGDGADGADSSAGGAGSDGADNDAGGDSSSGANGASGSAALDAEDEWFNLSKPGRYVFEIESAEEGTGTMSFATTKVSGGQATVKVEYELGDESFSSTVTGPVGEVEGQIVTSPAYGYLIAIQLGGIGAGALSGGEELEVGNKFSQQSGEGSMLIEVVGTDSYAGVDCYDIETRINGTLTQEVCTQEAFASAPYVAIYDENGDLSERVELVEFERN